MIDSDWDLNPFFKAVYSLLFRVQPFPGTLFECGMFRLFLSAVYVHLVIIDMLIPSFYFILLCYHYLFVLLWSLVFNLIIASLQVF